MVRYRRFLIISMVIFLIGCAKIGTYSIYIRYQSPKKFINLQEKIGLRVAIAPLNDERPDTLYIGKYTPPQGVSSYFKSEPFPLEKAIIDSLSKVLSQNGIKTIPISYWDRRPESLKTIDSDSVLMMDVKRFWTEGKRSLFRTEFKTSIHLIIHLGVKKEGKVFSRNIFVEKEESFWRFDPEKIEESYGKLLSEIFDSFFSNPY